MDKEKLNRLRRMAGAPVDYSAEPRKVTSLREDGIPGISQIFRGGDHKFYLVCDADQKSALGDVLTELDFPALLNILRSAKNTSDWELFPHNEKNKALDLARKRLATVTETLGYGAESRRPENTAYPSDEEIDSAVHGDDERSNSDIYKDLDKEDFTSEEEPVGDDYYSDDLDASDEFEPNTNICPDCEGGEHPPAYGDCERCGGEGEIFEGKEEKDDKDDDDKDEDEDDDKKDKKKSKKDDDKDEDDDDKDDDEEEVEESAHYHTDGNYPLSHVDDEDSPINVDSSYENVFDKPEENEEDYLPTNDTTPIKVPAKILNELKRVIKEVTAEAEKAKPRDFERAHYYEATAEAMQIVHDFLAQKTVQGMKQAQIYVFRMANVSRALFPDVVWKFIIDGGSKRSLKSYVNDVKEPVTGKPFGVIGISTLNKNTNTE